MSTSVTFNGTSYTVPAIADASWGTNVSNYLIAISTGCLQKTGGTFTLTAEVNFGATYGLKAAYLKSQTTNIAAAGFLELAKTDTISWRNNANSADLALTIDSSNRLTFNGVVLETAGVGAIVNADIAAGAAIDFSKLATLASGNILVGSAGGVATSVAMSGDATIVASGAISIGAGKVTNTMLAGAIAYSKLALTGAILNADLAGSIAYSKLTLTGSIVTADIASGLVLSAANGGTGIANNAAATLTRTGNHAVTLTTTNTTALTLPTTGTLSTLAGAEVITSKDHDGGTASNTSRLTVPKASLSTLTALTRKQGTIVYDTTANALLADDGSNLNSIGGGSGEKNYVTAPSTASGWTASNTGITVATTTTGLPRANTTKSGILITGVTGTTDYVYYRFIMDDADANKKLKFQFDMEPGTAVASDFEVRVYSNTAVDYTTGNTRLALSTDNSTPASLLPALTGTYRTTFDAPATTAKWIEVRIKMAASQAHTLVISDVIVGPGTVVQGAAVTGWTAYTPTWVSSGTQPAIGNGTLSAQYRRVGDTMEFTVNILSGTTTTYGTGSYRFALPSGFTINTSSLSANFNANTGEPLGVAMAEGATAFTGIALYATTTYLQAATSGASAVWGATAPFTPGASTANQSWAIKATVPINEWAGAGTVNVVQNDVSYASNSGTSDAADTTSFVYGPSGSTTPGVLTAARKKRVRFPTPILSTDRLWLEVQATATSPWIPLQAYDNGTGFSPFINQNSVKYGIGLDMTSTGTATDIDVDFGQYQYSSSTYGAAGGAWATNLGFWRVAKASGGQAVGFSEVNPGVSSGLVSASGLKGNTTGTTVATGYVGEKLTVSRLMSAATSVTNNTDLNVTASSLSLTPGVWSLTGFVGFVLGGTTVFTEGRACISTTTASVGATDLVNVQDTAGQIAGFVDYPSGNVPNNRISLPTGSSVVSISATTPYFLCAKASFTTSTCTVYGSLVAVRIA